MKFLLGSIIFAFLLTSQAAPSKVPMRSSGQFTVFDLRPSPVGAPKLLRGETGQDFLMLDADVLLISAERTREKLLQVFNVSSDRPGRIQLFLYSASRADDLIGVISSFEAEGWNYSVQIPDQIERQKLIRGIVHVLLLEIANRGQGSKSAELPLWLVEGLAMQVRATGGPNLAVGSVPVGAMMRHIHEGFGYDLSRQRRGLDQLAEARECLRANRPLTLSELSYPKAENVTGEGYRVFQFSSQLFVHQLMRRQNGAANLLAMLRELPNCWNWETAFLRAYKADFQRLLDVEKWWSVHQLAFTAYDPSQVWSLVASLDRLDRALLVQAQIRVQTNAVPERDLVSLQQVALDWDWPSQFGALQQRLPVLLSLRANSSAEVLALVDGYYRAIAEYLNKRAQAGRAQESRMQPIVSVAKATQDFLRDLETLDKQRSEMRPERR
jgi:hypothetical protein